MQHSGQTLQISNNAAADNGGKRKVYEQQLDDLVFKWRTHDKQTRELSALDHYFLGVIMFHPKKYT